MSPRPGTPPAVSPPATSGSPSGPAAFLSTNKPRYRVGESIKIIYGADQQGFVYLVSTEPDGQVKLLKKQAVSGNSFHVLSGKATAPAGQYELVAVYDTRGDLSLDQLGLRGGPKGVSKAIELTEEAPKACAVYKIRVGP